MNPIMPVDWVIVPVCESSYVCLCVPMCAHTCVYLTLTFKSEGHPWASLLREAPSAAWMPLCRLMSGYSLAIILKSYLYSFSSGGSTSRSVSELKESRAFRGWMKFSLGLMIETKKSTCVTCFDGQLAIPATGRKSSLMKV